MYYMHSRLLLSWSLRAGRKKLVQGAKSALGLAPVHMKFKLIQLFLQHVLRAVSSLLAEQFFEE